MTKEGNSKDEEGQYKGEMDCILEFFKGFGLQTSRMEPEVGNECWGFVRAQLNLTGGGEKRFCVSVYWLH